MTSTPDAGLASAEVAERVRRGEVNRARRSAWADYGVIVSRHALTVFNFVVVPTAVALFWFGDWRAGISVTGTALANTLVGLVQEWRAKRQLDRLAILTARKARVVRDGKPSEVLVDDVVLGDLVLLQAGETVVADGTLLESHYLEVDEALLTGESDPVRRNAGDRVLSGSICVTGEGRYRAEKVGAAAFAQSVTADAKRYTYTTSPITQALNRTITALSVAALALCALYGALRLLGAIDAEHMVRMIAATVVSTIPQGLVLTATVAFTIGAVVIGRRGALVQRLNAVEAMAAVNVVCTDKTGTLTSNRLKLDTLVVLTDELPESEVKHRLVLFACASIDRDNKNIQALRSALGTLEVEAVEHLPFNARTRFSAVRVRAAGSEHVLVLGAPEALASDLGPQNEQLLRLQGAGLRVLVFAESPTTAALEVGKVPTPHRLLALVALADELRPDAAAVLRALSAQGIAFKVISGDNPRTVQATVAPLELPMSHEPAVSGKDLSAAEDLVAFVITHSVFGRVEPLQKVAIVEALQKGGANVAMIGDGVNDVLPIKKADLGIAMGEGSPAAKTVSSLVLEGNNFAVLPEAIAEGRTIVRNLRRAGKLFLTKNVYSLAFILAYAVGLFDIPFPYLPQQVTLLNWMVIGVPALLMALTRERSGAPERAPFLLDVGEFALRTGLIFAGCGITILALGKHVWGVDEQAQRTMLLTALIVLGTTVVWRVLRGDGPRLATDRWLVGLSLAIVPIYAGFMYWPPAADFFRLTPLTGSEWLKVAAVAAPAFVLSRLAEFVFWGRLFRRGPLQPPANR